jgi:hypothetical protein
MAEIGFATTLSVPRAYFAVDRPPLRATRRLRLITAAAGTALYLLLWAAGVGKHDPRLLLVAPLPFALALSAGYAGVMNAAGRLRLEGGIAVAESVFILGLALAATTVMSALSATLLALTVGRSAGTVARIVAVRGLPQTSAAVSGVLRTQAWFAAATTVIVLQGQADLLAIGLIGSLSLAGVYGPLLRTAYGFLLIAEALSWGMYGGADHQAEGRSGGDPARSWLVASVALGAGFGVLFVVVAGPLLEFLLQRDIEGLTTPILLFGALILVRFVSFGMLIQIMREGRQRRQIPVLAAAAVVLIAGSWVGARESSMVILVVSRLASELVILAGYARVTQLARTPAVMAVANPGD